jgi:hypothetical protein
MDAAPILARIAEILNRHRLDVVMVGNAAAAIQGAPITTVDIDFLFRKTPVNVRKLKALTAELKGVMMRPYYPAVDMFRIMRDDDTLQIDFLTQVAGLRSFEALRVRATRVQFGDHGLYVASLADVIKSKKAAGRPKDLAVMYVLENALAQAANHSKDATGSSQKRE